MVVICQAQMPVARASSTELRAGPSRTQAPRATASTQVLAEPRALPSPGFPSVDWTVVPPPGV